MKKCNQENITQQNKKLENNNDTKKIVFDLLLLPLVDTFPLQMSQIGCYLYLQKFLNYKCFEFCKETNTNKLKENKNCIMRMGVEFSLKQSFLFAIANIYYSYSLMTKRKR